MKKQKITCEQAREYSVVKVLEKFGFSPIKINQKEAWYFSPFRTEKTSSFKVSITLNKWYDHGEGNGGNTLDLVVLLKKCSISEALIFLSEDKIDFSFQKQNNVEEEKKYSINKVKTLENKALLTYLNSRGISDEYAKEYCEEIYYEINKKKYFAISFKNNSNGYEIRNKYFKGCFGTKDMTLIDVGSSCINVFEGFIDFLSYLEIKENLVFENYLILNSLSNKNKALVELKKYSKINLFLDNDLAGNKATVLLKKELNFKRYIKIMDYSTIYKKHKDFNDYWVANKSD
ncbi:toprim domain-containing protein [Tenacibaculum finnmarkense genomovar finnmarkense]|uniref:toprim domain-containing protein n=1 Tax=Tenacibaculum finnmarkense TaxID=2781243 RepID=UPI001E40B46B|nr:toprim domain-containing protein [Tenacibaculum finnmarkense]MCD8417963.1 toprim domain-containing protein [Tenacibaculum finnmarkense genomovar finnmarkense]MCG8186350.1 toprim domain-containing protein [Tenacibaculum finnmarkense genomovar finnmarkense]MCG8202919.1 toprim domain-containing protein [Tenacibaculum finnmarkense genomovar finnmarkense]MCG8210151.1 toprim domain-containing protein [Tenacibaculum finnmarkense genomovar finnmarkense]MCG8213200.1 toprim domain-containing protein 